MVGIRFPLTSVKNYVQKQLWANEIHLFVAFKKSCANRLSAPRISHGAPHGSVVLFHAVHVEP